MSRIPFIEARFFNPEETRFRLEERLRQHLRQLRRNRQPVDVRPADEAAANDILELDLGLPNLLTKADETQIRRRVLRILDCRASASGLGHLKPEDCARLEVLKDGVNLTAILSEHQADELASALHSDMPWMAPATELVWHAMRRSVREGWAGLRIAPLLLDGPPGIGKSFWARRVGELLTVPTTIIEATSENASFGVVGAQRGWSGAHHGRLVETVLSTLVANPVIVVDEVEKAGTATSMKGQTFGLTDALLPLLEPMTARRWTCPYFQVRFDMSWVLWVLTCNDYRRLSAPLLNRCPPIRLRNLTMDELTAILRREGQRRKLSTGAIDAMTEALALFARRDHPPSLRVVSRLLQRAEDLEHRPLLH